MLYGRWQVALVAAVSLLWVAGARADSLLIDFAGLPNGTIVDDEYAADGITIIVENFNKDFGEVDDAIGDDPDWGVVFDTTLSNTADPDLEGPLATSWSTGNLDANELLGNVLIVQENFDGGCNLGTRCDNPDDEGSRPAGRIIFDSTRAIASFGFDLVDVESSTAEAGSVRFFDGGVEVGSLDFASLPGGLIFGNNSANRVDPTDAALLGLDPKTSFDRIAIELGGSGAVDNVHFTFVPEPSPAAMLGLGLLALGGQRRRAIATSA